MRSLILWLVAGVAAAFNPPHSYVVKSRNVASEFGIPTKMVAGGAERSVGNEYYEGKGEHRCGRMWSSALLLYQS